MDAANMLKPALARGEIQCIGATTLDEYRVNIEKDGALERRFQKVMVEPTTAEETLTILNNIKPRYEGSPRRDIYRRGPRSLREAHRPLHQRPQLPRQGYRRARRGRLTCE